ncbi:DNA topoisomerase IV, alpha subunit [Metschnikowia bicuspidata var. bicuspidata NRRL YB-4993]|uniref:DNA topoisomerase (ATP-hydrolyzing) n=1 Tax=Metschnikowia bicuspidata var. bicuspidata NRRL YB-4993 TaxID=869754 RepID=A0A1A0H6A6_9ASCO|nr:DNA topoisomerase IV, alpha subunit [Metschnikowia bicuspidata var. bicuspidata NRRL YB-4993]OBA19561.1 DNA topoisomerase IV, alpha subunit [Metschnikowia bicuspidata var. bicuspidata NRRL YB-4993]
MLLASRDEHELVLKTYGVSIRASRPRSGVFVLLREFSETESQASRFTAVLTALRLVTQNLRRQSTTTLRDIYYRDVSAFQGSQYRLNESLRLIASSLGYSLERDLKVFPSPKGLVYGGPHIRLELQGGADINLNYDGESVLIPTSIPESMHCTDNIGAIVVLEKEAVFKSFSGYLRHVPTPQKIIMLTGKGNPDRASVRFLSALENTFPHAPILVFVDSDVYGLRIWWTYMRGAGGPDSKVVFAGTYLLEHLRGHLTIAAKEWKLMMNFLKEVSGFQAELGAEAESLRLLKRELTRGMLLGKKAELNVMSDSSRDEDLNTYMWKKVAHEVCNKT